MPFEEPRSEMFFVEWGRRVKRFAVFSGRKWERFHFSSFGNIIRPGSPRRFAGHLYRVSREL